MTVSASAPGKVILFGEHAVVYGRPAIAAPLTQVAATAAMSAAPAGASFQIDAVDLRQTITLAAAPPDDPLAAAVRLTLDQLNINPPPEARLTVSSTIPLGRGLGSGAAIASAIVQAVANFYGQPLPPAAVSALVYQVEKLHHGTPSGIDNTVIAFRQPVYFVKGRPLQQMAVARPFTLLVGDTGVTASTRAVVGDLRRRWQAEPQRYEGYFDEIAALVQQAKITIEQDIFEPSTLGKLMNENQELLETLGVSSVELAGLIEAARRAGAWGAKLSGAGWGGNMIAVAAPEQAATVEKALYTAGAVKVIKTVVS